MRLRFILRNTEEKKEERKIDNEKNNYGNKK
jgi:hypothetical protein